MPLPSFDELHRRADALSEPVAVAVAGAADPTVLAAMRTAADRGWARPLLCGDGGAIAVAARAAAVDLRGIETIDSADPPATAVELVREGRAALLAKGLVSTPKLMQAVLDPEAGLRDPGRAISQVVLMEIPRDDRLFLLADTGVMVKPKLAKKREILLSLVDVARRLGVAEPKVAIVAASEVVMDAMPETFDAAELTRRAAAGEFPDCLVRGPLSFDLAYAIEAADRKRVGGPVVGAADAMLFPDLASANLTVKAIMYTADCRFGGVLRGTSVPVAFMSRADSAATRLNSLALALLGAGTGDDQGPVGEAAGV